MNSLSLLHKLLMTSFKYKKLLLWRKVWKKTNKKYKDADIIAKIHGFDVLMNYGYTYPYISRVFKTYNNPLLELANNCYRIKQGKIVFIDVGAAIGDTLLLILRNMPESIKEFYCVEGDDKFFEYLKFNLGKIENGHLIKTLLGSNDESYINELVHIHAGTASAIGEKKVISKSLDSVILELNPTEIDIIKIDVDGYDGLVLQGSQKLLQKYKPTIIFEWHPILIKQAKSDSFLPFKILKENGYNKFLWFTKYGTFSHFDYSLDGVSLWEQISLRSNHDSDFHFDIIALHSESSLDVIELAEMGFAKRKLSLY